MAVDLMIEVTKLFSLHQACTILEHGIRDVDIGTQWRAFSPTRFVYAFFTFNSIYSFDWSASIETKTAVRWKKDEKGHFPRGKKQFKRYIRFCSDTLGEATPLTFSDQLQECLALFKVENWVQALENIKPSNEISKDRIYREAFPNNFDKLIYGQITREDHYATLVTALMFIYRVRNNIFHGSKTRIEMESMEQQKRLLIYTALLISTNGLLFKSIERKKLGWIRPPVYLSVRPEAEPIVTSSV